MLNRVLSPRSRERLAAPADETAMRAQLTKLLGTPPKASDSALVLLRDMEAARVPLNPLVVERLCYELENRGLSTEGIFRVPGGTFASNAIFAALVHLRTGDEVLFAAEPNVHNLSAALKLYLLHTREPLVPLASYDDLLRVVRPPLAKGSNVERAAQLGRALCEFPLARRKVLQRLMLLCSECAKQSEVNQMSAKNLAIVFSPVLFHDDSEPLANLASNQGSKMQVLELLITHYDVAFPDPYEATYKPPARPGEVPMLVERDWSLMLAKAELVSFKSGDVVVASGAPLTCVYRVRKGRVSPGIALGSAGVLIAGDWFGERLFLGRRRCAVTYVALEDTELWALQPSHLELLWSIEPHLATAFFGNVAIALAVELRGQLVGRSADNLVAAAAPSSAAPEQPRGGRQQQRSTVAFGQGSTLRRQLQAMEEEEQKRADAALEEDGEDPASAAVAVADGDATEAQAGGTDDAALLRHECKLGKRPGMMTVTATELVFQGRKRFGGIKTVQIPYDAIDRISTSVSDAVVRGKRHPSKAYSRTELHTMTLVVRKRERRTVKVASKVFGFFAEAEAAETFSCVARLVQTAAEDKLAFASPRMHRREQEDDEDDDGDAASKNFSARVPVAGVAGDGGGGGGVVGGGGGGADETPADDLDTRVITKAVALFDYACEGFAFGVGDVLLLTRQKKDMRVRGRLATDGAPFAWFPRNYVEPVVWLRNVPGLPSAADLAPLLAVGERRTLGADAMVLREGDPNDHLFFIVSGVCRVVRGHVRHAMLGKMVAGDVFGEISLLLGGVASASVEVHSASAVVVAVGRAVLRATFSVRPDLAAKFYKLFSALNARRIERNTSLPLTSTEKRLSYMQSSVTKADARNILPLLRDSRALKEQLEENSASHRPAKRASLDLEGARDSVLLNAL